MFLTLYCCPTFICQLTVKCIVHWCVPMHVTLVVRQYIPHWDVRRNKLRYLVHLSDQVKVL